MKQQYADAFRKVTATIAKPYAQESVTLSKELAILLRDAHVLAERLLEPLTKAVNNKKLAAGNTGDMTDAAAEARKIMMCDLPLPDGDSGPNLLPMKSAPPPAATPATAKPPATKKKL